MRLKSISYQDTNWELEGLELGNVNLLVGRNATGKSRTLSTIDLLVKMVTQKRDLNWGSKWSIIYENEEQKEIFYEFKTSSLKQGVTWEKMSVDGSLVLRRSTFDEATVRSSTTGAIERISPPPNKLVLHIRRDVREYPFLEEIATWAETSYGFKFGNISPLAQLNQQEYDLLTAVEHIPVLLKTLGTESRQRIVKDFSNIGYPITDLSLRDRGDGLPLIFVKENSLSKPLPHYKLSQGMFRSLALITFLEYLTATQKPQTVIIDDLGEGLDYDKATKLGKLVFQKCAEAGIQLIATSNDSFLMDVVDIENWNVLYRTGKTVRAVNNHNHPELIEKFRFTGLSNFDFFASDFLKKQKAW
jgi:predicted ATPase